MVQGGLNHICITKIYITSHTTVISGSCCVLLLVTASWWTDDDGLTNLSFGLVVSLIGFTAFLYDFSVALSILSYKFLPIA